MSQTASEPWKPHTTQVNGRPAEWTDAIWRLWYTYVDAVDPKFKDEHVKSANYFTPRPYVDQYNRGSQTEGFTYTCGRDWSDNRVYQQIIRRHSRVGGDPEEAR